MPLSQQELLSAAVERTKWGYARENIVLDKHPFSFDNHNYLIEMYLDNHRYIVIEKAAQMGASVYGMVQALFVCDKLGKNVIYFFPTDTDVQDFSKTRVAPILEDSPSLASVVGDDSVGLRQVGAGWLYFRGMKSSIAMKSIPADCIIMDELDEVTEASESLADQRLNHSLMKWRLKLSTPTFEGFGIDREFKNSDRRYWNLVCRHCETRNICEFQFPDIVVIGDDETAWLQCRKCKKKLDKQYGIWIAENPDKKRIHGYHLCGLYSEYLDLFEIMEEYQRGNRRPEFYRSKLGLAWSDADMRITREMVQACRAEHEMHPEPHAYMGVDQKGDALHIVIFKRQKYTTKRDVLWIGTVKHFAELDQYMRRWDIDRCVIDGTPNQHSARDFAERFRGRVYLCYYNENQKGSYKWTAPKIGEPGNNWSVVANRTEALDAMYEEIIRREIALPQNYQAEFEEQLVNLAKVHEKDDDGNFVRAIYVRLGEDHYAHALCYTYMAENEFAQAPKSINVTQKKLSRVMARGRPSMRF